MRQLLFVVGLVFFFAIFYSLKNFSVTSLPDTSLPLKPSPSPTKNPTPSIPIDKKFLFVPYWAVGKEKITGEEYTYLVYFGVAPSVNGIDKQDMGYKNIPQFLKIAQGSKNLLAIRMVDSSFNSIILENEDLQKNIATDAAKIAKEFDFEGIVLDFEISSLSFSSVIKKITTLHLLFAKTVKQNNLSFYSTVYGDVFYRLRPYDVKTLSTFSDGIFIMAYDFHKARENPGPNFPLGGKEIFGYDFITMTNDFLNVVPKEKVIVVFGMFGYDWIVDAEGKSITTAKSLSLNKAKQKFLTNCVLESCVVIRDEKSTGTKVSYKDKDINHIVWFEDMESVEKKKQFLREKGISSFAFWAYSYF